MIIDFKNLNGGGGQPYVLPIASATTLGGIKVGNNLSINATTGVLDATGGAGECIVADPTDPSSLQEVYLAINDALSNDNPLPDIRLHNENYDFDIKVLGLNNGVIFAEALQDGNDENFAKTKIILSPTEGIKYIADNVIFADDTYIPETFYSTGTVAVLTDGIYRCNGSDSWEKIATMTDLAGKQNTLTAGTNITISNNTIAAQTFPIVVDYATWETANPDMYNNADKYVIKYEDTENNITWHLRPTRRYYSASSNKRCFEAISIGGGGTLLQFIGTTVRSAGAKTAIYQYEYDLTPKTV